MRSTEIEIIKIIEAASRVESMGLLVGPGDDCALVRPPEGEDLLLTKDCMVEGVHFSTDYFSPEAVGRRLAVANLSDIGASGGRSIWALLGLGFDPKRPISYYARLIDGLLGALKEDNVALAGGDTVASPRGIFLSLTLIGKTPQGRSISRKGARPGDVILSSGSLGGSHAGLLALTQKLTTSIPYPMMRCLKKLHICPQYPKGLGEALLEADCVTSAIDSSDGLAKDLRHIGEMSGVRCILYKEKIPIPRPARYLARIMGMRPYELALRGGEDFALIWTTPSERLKEARRIASSLGHRAFEIGRIEAGSGLFLEDSHGLQKEVLEYGYTHK